MFLAVELPAEDGVEALDFDRHGPGGGGRDLDVDAEPCAGRGLGGAEGELVEVIVRDSRTSVKLPELASRTETTA